MIASRKKMLASSKIVWKISVLNFRKNARNISQGYSTVSLLGVPVNLGQPVNL